ncbi:sulfurtransferase [Roseomonas sp. NAR14]|uniref:Sulfurtransferase n=1 Tax=Roseomonas acroporae TaxID=2937791 RepID=A0A9X1YDC5_9PROT|nr:sulfurtransferase [Roseomonas acroporae]MCK8787717.1 sulfurtransferase [Roseomonas acroporae]
MSEKVLVEPVELSAMLQQPGTVVIDTRAPAAYAAGHIPGAVNIHDIFTFLATSTREGMRELRGKFAAAFGAAGLSGEETAVVYEESMDSGFGQSCRGYFLLKFLGYPKAMVLHGGFTAWRKAGLPTSTDPATPEPKIFPESDAGLAMMLDRDDMLAALADERVCLLDVRDVDEWLGTSSSPYGADFCPRKGRIPGARWIEWYRLMKPSPNGPLFKSRDEILAECHSVGVTAETPVYLYCFKGARASNSLVALKEAGIGDVRLYFGSWNEWSRDEACPIESGPPWAPVAA